MNVGQRTVTITEVGLLAPNGKRMMIWPINPLIYPDLQHASNLPAEIKRALGNCLGAGSIPGPDGETNSELTQHGQGSASGWVPDGSD